MTDYPIVANCNFESRDDQDGKDIHEARKAIDAGLTDDVNLVEAMEELEEALTEHADRVYVMHLPNITDVFYGRDVGYNIERVVLDKATEAISATHIRANAQKGG